MVQVAFFAGAIGALGGAIAVIALRNPFYSVLALIVHLISLAGLFLLLHAELIAATQIVVYAGAVMVLYLFVAAYGAVAGNLALTGTAVGGVYLGGGIAPKILPRLKTGLFLQTFEAKGRFVPYLERVAVRVILNDRAALLGAARHAALLLG